MAELRKIDPTPYGNRLELPPPNLGKPPKLEWIAIDKLRVDGAYQRDIFGRGAKNIRDIAAEFRWMMFEVVTVTPIEGGLYSVVNGQHRATAAALRGLERVPCAVITATQAEQAQAFEGINYKVTAVSAQQLHVARVAAGNEAALALDEACRAAGVKILAYPVPATKIKVGETLAAGELARMLRLYGRDVLVIALRCITETRKGNAGMVRKAVISALCSAFEAEPDWRVDEDKLIKAMWKFDIAGQYIAAAKKSLEGVGSVSAVLLEAICDHLDKNLGSEAA